MATEKETRELEIIVKGQQANASIKEMGAAASIMNNQLAKMAADDPNRQKLIEDLQALRGRIKGANDEIRGTVVSLEQMAAANAKTVADGQKVNASFREMKEAAGVLERQLEELSADDPGRAQLLHDYQELKTRMAAAREEMNSTATSAEQLRQEQEQLAAAQARTIEAGQRQGASMQEMSAAARLLHQRLQEVSMDDPGRAAMIRDYQLLQQRVSAAESQVKTYVKTEQELREEQERLNRETKEVILNGQRVDATFNQMKASSAALEKQLHSMAANDPARAQLLRDYQEMQKRLEAVKKELGDMPKEGGGGGGFLGQAAAIAGFTVGLDQAVDLVKELGAEVVKTVGEFTGLRGNINTLTGAQGEELDKLTVGVAALAKTYHKEYDEILVASNTLSKQMGIGQAEALELIKKGFQAGADVNGEFLDQVKEYPAQFKAMGASASQAIAVISQSQTSGIFSDKGADVFKEFNLRITEQTKSTSDAMEAAFGTEFTRKIFDGINNGSMTSVEALAKVAKQMDETKIPANQLQTVVADVFGGPGEDAGMDYLKSLKNVGGGVDALIDKTNAYTQRQDALFASNETLARSQNDLAKQFEGAGSAIETGTNYALSLLYTLLASLATVFGELWEPVQSFWRSMGQIADVLGLTSKEGITMRDVGNALTVVFRLLYLPARALYEALAWAAHGLADMAEHSAIVRFALLALTAPLRMLKDSVVLFFDVLANAPAYFAGFSSAADTAFSRVGRAIRSALRGDLDGAKAEFTGLGTASARAFQEAFAQAMAAKPNDTPAPAGEDGPTKPAGGDGTTQAQRDKAAKDAQKAREKAEKEAKQARDKADSDKLAALKALNLEELKIDEAHDALRRAYSQRALNDEERRRELQRKKIFDDATAHVDKLTGLEVDYGTQVQAIVAERDLALRELEVKFKEEDEKRRQDKLDEQIKQEEADAEAKLAKLELDLANGVLGEWAFQDAVYAVKVAAAERELALLKAKSGSESAEYKKMYADLLKLKADYVDKTKGLDTGVLKFEEGVQKAKKVLGDNEVAALGELFGKKSAVYKAAVAVQKAFALTELGISLYKQIAANTEAGTKISAMAPPVSVPLGVAYTIGTNALAVATTAANAAKIAGFSFAKGGRTGGGMQVPADGNAAGTFGMMLQLAGVRVGNGKLIDDSGFAVAGIVHEDEYVIPKWMRADPQVAQFETWLEARRLRGYAQGGATTDGGSQATPADLLAGGTSADTLAQLVQVLGRLDSRLASVEDWQRTLRVEQQDPRELLDDLNDVQRVQSSNGIRKNQ